MQDRALSLIGQIAISWNKIENVVLDLLKEYLDTDSITTKILLKPLKPSGQEELLRKLVSAKETSEDIKEEVAEALKRCATLRENRNTILHKIGIDSDDLSESAVDRLQSFYEALIRFHIYFQALRLEIITILADRAKREIHGDALADDDELRSFPTFNAPDRPPKFPQLKVEDIT